MKTINKKIFSIIGVIFFLIFLTSIQVSFINFFSIDINLFLVLILYLIITKNNYQAIIFSWLGGILIDSGSFSILGINSLSFLFLTVFFISLHNSAFLTSKIESVLFTGIAGVGFFHFLNWLITNALALLKIGAFEKFGFQFFNFGFLMELIMAPILLLIIFRIKRNV